MVIAQWWSRVRRLLELLDVVKWPCGYCNTKNETPMLLWRQLRTELICAGCSYMQNYPAHIRHFDPVPYGTTKPEYHPDGSPKYQRREVS